MAAGGENRREVGELQCPGVCTLVRPDREALVVFRDALIGIVAENRVAERFVRTECGRIVFEQRWIAPGRIDQPAGDPSIAGEPEVTAAAAQSVREGTDHVRVYVALV